MFRSTVSRLHLAAKRVPVTKTQSLIRASHVGQRYQSSGPASSLCPSCSRRLPTQLPACPSCGYISLIPPSRTYHSLFGLPYEPNPFLIDAAKLKQEFRNAQAVCHPDTWTYKGPDKYEIAQNLSSTINEAYQGLLRPIKRVEYVLSLNGHAIGEEDKVDDLVFVEEVIETMEQLEEFGPEAVEDVKAIASTNDVNVKKTLEEIEKQVEAGEWSQAQKSAARLRYFDKIGTAISRWSEQHDVLLD